MYLDYSDTNILNLKSSQLKGDPHFLSRSQAYQGIKG